jgi:hypothetical protein
MTKDPRRFYVYAFLREKDSAHGKRMSPYYIGKGKDNRAFRKRSRGTHPPKDKSLIVFIQEGLTEEEALSLERYCIAIYGRLDLGTGTLHNLTDGGEGIVMLSPEIRRKLSEASKGRQHSEETRRKMSKSRSGPGNPNYGKRGMPSSFKGRSHTEESKRKISEAKKGRKQSADERRMRSECAPPRYEYEVTSPSGQVFIVYNLAAFAREHGMRQHNLASVARGRIKQHKGWKIKILKNLRQENAEV